MKRLLTAMLSTLTALLPLAGGAQETLQFDLELTNHWTEDRRDEPVVVRLADLNPGFTVRSAVVMDADTELPSQLDDLDMDLKADELALVVDVPRATTKTLSVTLSSAPTDRTYPARVYAELLIRDAKKNQHAPAQSVTVPGTTNFYNMVFGHGPMFESEFVGYRIYFNQKQTVDPYGKFQQRLELIDCHFYPNDEQLQAGFGDDVLMVGNSCGIGTLKGWDGQQATHIEPIALRTERILARGPIRTVTDVQVQGWTYQGSELTMTNRYILYAGHRDLRVETTFAEPLGQETFCTGAQRIMGNETQSFSDHDGLVGSWGRHWPVTDTVKYAKETIGIATCIPRQYVKEEVSDKDNFLYTIAAPGEKGFHHYTMFTSCKETFGYATAEAWFDYLPRWKDYLMHPVEVKIKRR